MKHISVEQGKKCLAEVITGAVTHFPGSSALLVTPELNKLTDAKYELSKAKAVLALVDGPEQYVVKAILPVSAARNMPSNERLEMKLTKSITRGVSIGSFSNPPNKNARTKAIIDIHNDQVIAVVPVRFLDRLVSAIVQSQNSGAVTAQNKPKSEKEPESSAKRNVSASLVEPSEAKFLFTASDSVETDPNSDEVVVEQETPKSPVTIAPKRANETAAQYQARVRQAQQAAAARRRTPTAPTDNQKKDTTSPADGEQVVNLALAERQKITVLEFLGMVGPYLGLDFMYDEKDVTQEVTINPHGKFRGPIKVKDLYPLLEEVLKFKNLAMTRGKGNLVKIAPKENALDIDPALQEIDGGKVEQGDGIIQRVFKLKHISTAAAQELLEKMRLTTSITAIAETKTLILTGYAHRMTRIETLLNIVDRPGEPKKFRFRQLQYTMAETLAPKIQSLAEQLGTISITVAATEAEPARPSIPPKRSTETAAQYAARVRQAEQAAARARAARSAATRTSTARQQPESTLPTVYLDADERTNRILMIGLDEQLDDIEELISTLDVVQQDLRTLELYKIHHVGAEDVKRQLEELGIISPSLTSPYSPYSSSRITTGAKPPTSQTAAQQRQSTLSRTQMAESAEALMEEPQVIVVEPTNSLLVNATAEQHVEIAEILSYVDAETDQQEIPYKLYPLENQSPEHLVTVLEPLIQENIMDKEGKVESVRQKQEDQITIVPDPNTFSLIVYANKKNQEWIKNLIDQLDKRRPQVLIDATLVLVSKTDSFEYDLNIIQSFPDLTDTSGLTTAIMPIPTPFDGNGGNNLVQPLTDSSRDRFIDWQANSGNGTFFYGDEHINILLTAMQQKDYGRVLAKPKILVNDNQPGMITVLDRTYVTKQTGTVVEGVSPVVQTGVEYQDYEAGITLDITPHISRGEFLRLDITLDQSDFGTITGEKPPDKTEAKIDTTITIPDGSTIILGGLVKLNQSKGGTKVPLLGDIPLIGGLFRSTTSSDITRNLYVFVKAEIIRPMESEDARAELEDLSKRNRDVYEKQESEFQEYQDWPGVTPKEMEPLKALDAE
ncbi:MAG: secretin N-terminal domain-containing protein [Planctomycetota bacterium]